MGNFKSIIGSSLQSVPTVATDWTACADKYLQALPLYRAKHLSKSRGPTRFRILLMASRIWRNLIRNLGILLGISEILESWIPTYITLPVKFSISPYLTLTFTCYLLPNMVNRNLWNHDKNLGIPLRFQKILNFVEEFYLRQTPQWCRKSVVYIKRARHHTN